MNESMLSGWAQGRATQGLADLLSNSLIHFGLEFAGISVAAVGCEMSITRTQILRRD